MPLPEVKPCRDCVITVEEDGSVVHEAGCPAKRLSEALQRMREILDEIEGIQCRVAGCKAHHGPTSHFCPEHRQTVGPPSA